MKKAISAALALTLGTVVFMGAGSIASMQQMQTMQDGAMIGNMSREEFARLNKQGDAAVAAVTPNSSPLSKADEKMMMEVAMGGMMQLEVSRAALQKVTSEEARILAQSEVEEQTGLSNKLKEIAAAKNITLPSSPDSKTQSMVSKMQAMSGADFDRYYVRESGVKGHEKLDKTMTKVQSKAADPALKGIAAAALPLVRTHLQVSRDVVSKMSGKGTGNNSNGNTKNSNSSTNSNSNSNQR